MLISLHALNIKSNVKPHCKLHFYNQFPNRYTIFLDFILCGVIYFLTFFAAIYRQDLDQVFRTEAIDFVIMIKPLPKEGEKPALEWEFPDSDQFKHIMNEAFAEFIDSDITRMDIIKLLRPIKDAASDTHITHASPVQASASHRSAHPTPVPTPMLRHLARLKNKV